MTSRSRHDKIRLPRVHTYEEQIQKCHDMYSKLELEKHSYSVPGSPFSYPYRYQQPRRRFSRRATTKSAPLLLTRKSFISILSNNHTVINDVDNVKDSVAGDLASSAECDSVGNYRKRTWIDSIKLSQYLEINGFGSPIILLDHSKESKVEGKMLFRGQKLPKNPILREKIKGRARLDVDLANQKAIAFCEQLTSKPFRSASANYRNQEAMFVEKELREKIDFEDDLDDEDELTGKNKRDLAIRVLCWLDGVEKAFMEDAKKRANRRYYKQEKKLDQLV